MPIKGGRLTPQEKRFAEHMASTNDPIYAATKAGYGSPAQRAHQVLKRPAVNAEIVARSEARLQNEIVPAALQLIADFIADPNMHPKIRLDAAKAGLNQAKGAAGALAKDEADWTLADIQARIRQVDAALIDLNTIDHEPAEPASIEAAARTADGLFD